MSPSAKKLVLFRLKKYMLVSFLYTGTISQAQHDISLSYLIEKMGIKDDQQ